jgi:hypothetical protein
MQTAKLRWTRTSGKLLVRALQHYMRSLPIRMQIFTSPLQCKSAEFHQAGPGTDRHIWYCKLQVGTYYDPVAPGNGPESSAYISLTSSACLFVCISRLQRYYACALKRLDSFFLSI